MATGATLGSLTAQTSLLESRENRMMQQMNSGKSMSLDLIRQEHLGDVFEFYQG